MRVLIEAALISCALLPRDIALFFLNYKFQEILNLEGHLALG